VKTLPLSLLLLAALGLALPLRAADVAFYGLTKAQFYAQSSTATPSLLPTGAHTFAALVDASAAGSVSSAVLRLPSLADVPFGPVSGVGALAVAQPFDTLAALDAAFPSGNYRFTINGVNDGTRTPTLNLGANAYPTTPQVTNFTAAQDIDWTQDFTVTWVPFAGGDAQDFIQLRITRSNGSLLFATPSFGQTGALTGTATSTSIPAGTFVPGRQYTATLAYGNVVTINLTAYGLFDFVPGVTAFARTTEFPMSAPGTPPQLVIAKGAAAGSYDLTWNADIGRAYDLRRSQDFVTWTRVALVTADATTETVTDTPAASVKARFYRLDAVP
jgi:hypothetical protein